MISSGKLREQFDPLLLAKACCPLCLSSLCPRQGIGEPVGGLECVSCGAAFPVLSGVPVFLLDDENWAKKSDEIEGEVLYNVRKIPMEVHQERNVFVDGNTRAFLSMSGTDLSRDDVLIVGCSMAELEFFAPMSGRVTCLDIGPKLTADCRDATVQRQIPAAWVCGDGECLPFEDESFDAIVVRQSLHHMLRYFSAICEFFRVCRRGGRVLIIDEPFSPPKSEDVELFSGADEEIVFDAVQIGQLRSALGVGGEKRLDRRPSIDVDSIDRSRPYIEPNRDDPESLLADKYHSFSLLSCLAAVRQHASSYDLSWPREIAWSDESGETVRFCHAPNPHFDKSLLERMLSPGNVSVAAFKTERTRLLRKRTGLRPIPFSIASKLAGRA